MLTSRSKLARVLLFSAGGLCVVYCLAVLGLVAVAPDLRLRFLLVDDVGPTASAAGDDVRGVIVQQSTGAVTRGETIQPGDVLLQIGAVPIDSFLDLIRAQLDLRRTGVEGDSVVPGTKWVSVTIRQAASGRVMETQLQVQPLPADESFLTLVWLLLQLAILSVGALVFWHRPFDHAARQFFVMCIVTLGGFVGGFHWWLLAGNFWLTAPFVLCALLVPVVTLHFFLLYPRPKFPLSLRPVTTLAVLYAAPALAWVGFLIVQFALWRVSTLTEGAARAAEVSAWLSGLRWGIYAYLAIAGLYYLATLGALVHSVLTTRNALERSQVLWILWAGLIATGFIGYALMLAYWSRVEFALGGARLPMFAASLLFMLAYAVGIARYKLMLTDDLIRRGPVYYSLRLGGTGLLAAAIVVAAVGAGRWVRDLAASQLIVLGAVFGVLVVILVSSRDGWQQWIERRFFRERYRLDKALQRINRAVAQLADPEFLTERLLSSCRDVLQVEWAALYRREVRSDRFQLAAVEGGAAKLPLEWTPTAQLLDSLAQEGVCQRQATGRPELASATEAAFQQLSAEVLHGLEIDGELAGLVVLGPKQDGGFYSAEDLTFLTALAQITGVALHCVRVHNDLTHLNEELRLKVERIAQQRQQILMLQAELAASDTQAAAPEVPDFQRDFLKGESPALVRVLDTARKVAASDATVLVRGESGTGKELLARVLHENSPRRKGPLVCVHCAALAPGVLESELFGHVRGAFTGANSDRQGRFELAHGGTLFLDEIGDISPETQVKLLRVLQEREFEPVGGSQKIRVDVRLIAATHQDLEQRIAAGQFRQDLYYRLNVITMTLPPLRERKSDLHELAAYFLKQAAARSGKRVCDFEDAALDALLRYDWPGNIRELENIIERAVVLADRDVITLADLPADLQPRTGGAAAAPPVRAPRGRRGGRTAPPAEPLSWRDLPGDEERRRLVTALQQTAGNKARAARLLGLPRSTFFSKLKKYALSD